MTSYSHGPKTLKSKTLKALERIVHGKAAHAVRKVCRALSAIDFADIALAEHLLSRSGEWGLPSVVPHSYVKFIPPIS